MALHGWALFDLVRELGRGSSGTAHLVHRKRDGVPMVIKVIQVRSLGAHDGLSCSALQASAGEVDESALNEVKILTGLRHQHIIGYYGSFVHEARLHILMDYADGEGAAAFGD